MDLSPEALKKQVNEKKLEAFREELLPLLEKHNAAIVGTFIPIQAKTEDGQPEIVLRAGTEVRFKEDAKEETPQQGDDREVKEGVPPPESTEGFECPDEDCDLTSPHGIHPKKEAKEEKKDKKK